MQRTVSRLAAGGVALCCVGLGASACGGPPTNGVSSESATAILAAARAAESKAQTFQMTASASKGGRTDHYLFEKKAPADASEGVALGNGVRYAVTQIGTTAYFRGDAAYLADIGASPAGQARLVDHWIQDTINSVNSPQLDVYSTLAKLVDEALTSHGALTKGGTSTVDGQQVIALTDKVGGGTVYVATTGTPYPVEVTGHTTSGVAETLVFSKWNQAVSIVAPPSYVPGSQITAGG